ncbi:hypothetical protein [methane-oxidizing endosymbiont of Gigantopelta aegis]|uniref:hypothetical protein n=1 Tax=methane-oxidizing endosymbiont of Gigantopelta aegis TaxID=2794938 RepID=UPI0018DE7E38|nr:hypothetical protein [methane-oxidizing endosymbiont of Gigantopelta aegis]
MQALKSKPRLRVQAQKRKAKAKLIHIAPEWEDAINEYQDGTLTAYIRLAIREKMKRDGIL